MQPIPSELQPSEARAPRPSMRTCVGCGVHDAPSAMVHVVAWENAVVFDALFSRRGGVQDREARGRGAHLHARPGCLAKAPAGLARSMRRPIASTVAELGAGLEAACDRRMEGLLVTARRLGAVAIGTDAAIAAIRRGAPLVVVAVDAGSVAQRDEVTQAVGAGRAIAWRTKEGLASMLAQGSPAGVALCAVSHAGIAEELKRLRAAADAGRAATRAREDARCRRPEGR